MADLPTDIWQEITSYVLFSDFQALLTCGSPALSTKIIQSLKRVTAEIDLFAKFPSSVFNLPQIVELTVKRRYFIPKCILALNGASILPSKPVITLKYLELDFAQSLSILANTDPSLSPLILFPNLTTLRLTDGIGFITSSMLQSLPAGLETLFIAPASPSPKSAFSASVFQYLPRNLQNLHLETVEIAVQAGEMRFLPQSLKRLSLQSLVDPSRLSIGEMPCLLEELSIWYKFDYEARETQIPVSILPASLRRFKCDSADFTLDAPLPPYLEEFSAVNLNLGELIGEELFAKFPKSMTSVPSEVLMNVLLTDRLSERFPQVSRLEITDSMSKLPTLGTLFEQGFPLRLTVLQANVKVPPNMRVQLPGTLTRLGCFPSAKWLQNLPPGLQSLDFRSYTIAPSEVLQPSDLAQLPSGLTTLFFSGCSLDSPKDFFFLKRLSALKSLSISYVGAQWLAYPFMSSFWPKDLEYLDIAAHHIENMEWLSCLSSLVHLKTFNVVGSFDPNLGSSHLDKLPRGLQSMRMWWIPLEGFRGLPLSLRMLSVVLDSSQLDLDTLVDLPPKLQYLLLVGGGMEKIDPNILLPALPTGLSTLYISAMSSSESNDMLKQYYGDEKWQDVMTHLLRPVAHYW